MSRRMSRPTLRNGLCFACRIGDPTVKGYVHTHEPASTFVFFLEMLRNAVRRSLPRLMPQALTSAALANPRATHSQAFGPRAAPAIATKVCVPTRTHRRTPIGRLVRNPSSTLRWISIRWVSAHHVASPAKNQLLSLSRSNGCKWRTPRRAEFIGGAKR